MVSRPLVKRTGVLHSATTDFALVPPGNVGKRITLGKINREYIDIRETNRYTKGQMREHDP